MEKINFKNSRDLNLVGNFYTNDSDSVIIMSHGFTGDKSEWGRFDKMEKVLYDAGYNVLNFDFSGSGESDDDSLAVWKQVDDLKCAIKHVKAKGLKKIGLLGLSLGGLVDAKVYNPEIKTMIWWAPVTNKVNYTMEERYSPEMLKEVEEKGYLTYNREKGTRKIYLVDKQMLEDRLNLNQEELLSGIDCPVLIVHGDADNRVPYEDSMNAMNYLSKNSLLYVISGADHHFNEHLPKFIDISLDWFREHLPIK